MIPPRIRNRLRIGDAMRTTLVLLLIVLTTACGRWERQQHPTPWVAPDRLAIPYFKRGSDPGLGSPQWRDTVRGRKYNPHYLADDIEKYMLARGMFARWPQTGTIDWNNGERTLEVIAPFRFTLVSVDPMTVLMTPWPFTAATHDDHMPGFYDQRFPGIRRMKNFVEPGTTAPFAPGMQYFLPDLGVGPSAVAWSGDEASIPLAGGERLVLTRRDSIVETRRVAR